MSADLELQELKQYFNSIDLNELAINAQLGISSQLRLAEMAKDKSRYVHHLKTWKHELETNRKTHTL